MVKSCCVCKTSGNDSKKSYFRIPKVITHRNEDISKLSRLRRKKWCALLNLSSTESAARICSDHFKSGQPAGLLDKDDIDWIPNQNLHFVKPKKKKIYKTNENPGKSDSNTKQKPPNITCRFCAEMVLKSSCVNIFEDENHQKLLNSIATVLSYPISILDKLPHHACKPCIRKVEICSDWIHGFHAAEKKLRETFSSTEMNDKEIFEEIQQKDNLKPIEQNPLALENPETNKKFTKEQIQSLLENDSSISEDEDLHDGKSLVKKRKSSMVTKISPLEKKTLKCNNCFKKFETVDDLQIHKNFCKLFYCQLCKPQVSFKDKEELVEHKRNCHTDLLMCHLCGNSYSQSYLIKHFRNHFESSKACPVCGKVLKNTTLLMAHMGKIHENRYSQVCDSCGGTFKNLKKHLNECKSICVEEES